MQRHMSPGRRRRLEKERKRIEESLSPGKRDMTEILDKAAKTVDRSASYSSPVSPERRRAILEESRKARGRSCYETEKKVTRPLTRIAILSTASSVVVVSRI